MPPAHCPLPTVLPRPFRSAELGGVSAFVLQRARQALTDLALHAERADGEDAIGEEQHRRQGQGATSETRDETDRQRDSMCPAYGGDDEHEEDRRERNETV